MKMLPILLAFGIATASVQALDRTHPPAAGPLPAVTFPDPVTETLPNGLTLFVLPIHKAPMVTYRLMVKSGDSSDGSKPGLASLTAALLNKGTATLTASEFAQKTDFLGISVEAGSSDDALTVTASGLSCYSHEILGFLRDAALRPAFRGEELEKEKVKMVSELAQKKMDPEDLSMRLRDKLLYGRHPYGAYPTPESVQSITGEDLVKFHASEFLPDNATLVVVGEVDPAAVRAQVREVFGDWKSCLKHNAPDAATDFPLIQGVTVHVVDRPGSVQSNILVAGRGVPKSNPDLPELSAVNSVLGGGMSGRLAMNLREKHGFTYGSTSGFAARKLGGTFSAGAEVRNAVTGAAVQEILNELKRISSEPIPESELALQRSLLVGNFLLSVENEKRMGERLQEIDLYGLPADFYKTYAARVAGLKPERASELAQQYIDPNDLVIIAVGEAKEIVPQLEKFGKVTVYDADLKEKK